MITYYCPNCWEIVKKGQQTCPRCGFILDQFQNSDYEDKLIAALHHSVSERKIMAAQILGDKQSEKALPEFLNIIESDETNYFFLKAVLIATAKITHPLREIILNKAAQHPSELVSRLANELLDQLYEDIN